MVIAFYKGSNSPAAMVLLKKRGYETEGNCYLSLIIQLMLTWKMPAENCTGSWIIVSGGLTSAQCVWEIFLSPMGSERGYHLHLADAGRSVQKFPSTAPVLGTWICYYRDVWNSRNDVAAWCQTTFWNTRTKNKYGSLLNKKEKGKKSTLFVGNKKLNVT